MNVVKLGVLIEDYAAGQVPNDSPMAQITPHDPREETYNASTENALGPHPFTSPCSDKSHTASTSTT
jgi:hypothetical protein